MKFFELSVSLLSSINFFYLLMVSVSIRHTNGFLSGSGAVPAVFSGFLFLFSIIWAFDIFFQILREIRRGDKLYLVTASCLLVIIDRKRVEIIRFVSILTLTIIYIYILMPLLGFMLSTLAFLIFSLLLFGQIHWLKCILMGLLVSCSIYIAFRYFLHLPLPR